MRGTPGAWHALLLVLLLGINPVVCGRACAAAVAPKGHACCPREASPLHHKSKPSCCPDLTARAETAPALKPVRAAFAWPSLPPADGAAGLRSARPRFARVRAPFTDSPAAPRPAPDVLPLGANAPPAAL